MVLNHRSPMSTLVPLQLPIRTERVVVRRLQPSDLERFTETIFKQEPCVELRYELTCQSRDRG
jgi:hypothetical protein